MPSFLLDLGTHLPLFSCYSIECRNPEMSARANGAGPLNAPQFGVILTKTAQHISHFQHDFLNFFFMISCRSGCGNGK